MNIICQKKKHDRNYLKRTLKQLRPDEPTLKIFLRELDRGGYNRIESKLTEVEKDIYIKYVLQKAGY